MTGREIHLSLYCTVILLILYCILSITCILYIVHSFFDKTHKYAQNNDDFTFHKVLLLFTYFIQKVGQQLLSVRPYALADPRLQSFASLRRFCRPE